MKKFSIISPIVLSIILISATLFSQTPTSNPLYQEYLENTQNNNCNVIILQYKAEMTSEIDTVKCYRWMAADDEWLLNQFHINTYDDYGRLAETVTKYLNLQTMEFVKLLRHSYNYYPNDSIKSHQQDLWNPELDGGSWDNSSLDEYEYDNQDRLIFNLTYFSPYGSHELNLGNRKFYTYNNESMVDTVITQYFNNNENDWYYSYRYRYYYDEQMRLIDSFMDWANNQQGSYASYQRETITYKDDEQKAEAVTFYYNIDEWTYAYLETITLNEFQLPDSILYQNWNSLDNIWDTTVMELAIFNYNESGKLKEYITQSYYFFFVNNQRQVYYHDENNNVIEMLSQQWDFSNEEWLNVNNCFYPLPPVITDIGNVTAEDINVIVYPNPATDWIQILTNIRITETDKIILLNSNGQVLSILEAKKAVDRPVDFSNMNPGVYFIQFIRSDSILTKKILKH